MSVERPECLQRAPCADAERNLAAVKAICSSLEAHALADADRLLAPNAAIYGAPLYTAVGAAPRAASFHERFDMLERGGVSWKLIVDAIEALDENLFVVTAVLSVALSPGSPGYAGLTGSVWYVRDGLLESLTGFDSADEARLHAQTVMGRRSREGAAAD